MTKEVSCPENGIIQGIIEPGEVRVGDSIAAIAISQK